MLLGCASIGCRFLLLIVALLGCARLCLQILFSDEANAFLGLKTLGQAWQTFKDMMFEELAELNLNLPYGVGTNFQVSKQNTAARIDMSSPSMRVVAVVGDDDSTTTFCLQ